jgi:hypothetical protein
MSKGDAARFYNSKAWRKARKRAMQLAGLAGQRGYIVDHKIRLERAPHLALDQSNLRPMTRADHNRRHATAELDPARAGASLDGQPLGPAHPWNRKG